MIINPQKALWVGVLGETLYCLKITYEAYQETKDKKLILMAEDFKSDIEKIKEKIKAYG